MITYDGAEARKTDRAYMTPDVTRQRMRTLEALRLQAEESVIDIGCGSGLLAENMAALVSEGGRVVGVDSSPDMLALAERRCADLPQVRLKEGRAEDLLEESESFDAVACIQVLLYISAVESALAEMHRVLKPGGRLVILETDWRGTVLNSSDDALTRKILAAWDADVASPNLPLRLGPLLKARGFAALGVEAFPIVNTSGSPGNFSMGMLEQFTDLARAQGAVARNEIETWLEDLRRKDAEGAYFFCVNRFIFSAVKV